MTKRNEAAGRHQSQLGVPALSAKKPEWIADWILRQWRKENPNGERETASDRDWRHEVERVTAGLRRRAGLIIAAKRYATKAMHP